MCGIAGYFRRQEPADRALLGRMCDRIHHRGPDDTGMHLDGECAIGMRRLSIIDLNTGHQPIPNEDETIWVVFNGEIYNYQELRDELEAKGHRFRTNSDTEILVHLYEQEGPEGVRRLRGMFGYAIWDAPRKHLFLARDRFGKKPLYYAALPGSLYFGSELKCLAGLPISYEIDPEALQLYFLFGYLLEPDSPYRSIRKLGPASWLLFDTTTGRIRVEKYWESPLHCAEPKPDLTREKAKAQIRELFDESVRIRMIADVPLGAFLSGGIDSSSVVASMALQSKEPVRTFSIGFEESRFNELPYARLVAERYRTEHHEIVVRPNSVDLVHLLARSFDEPFGDASAIPTYIVSEFARRHVKVALSGDGGDELFAGYESFFLVDKYRMLDAVPVFLRKLVGAVASRLPYQTRGKNFLRMISRTTPLERYLELNFTPGSLRQRLVNQEWEFPLERAIAAGRFAAFLPTAPADPVSQAMFFELTAKLTSDMLVKVDRMSMAASLEVRCPLLDHKLAELAASIPYSWNMRNGKGKTLLIEALGDRLPPTLLNRPKWGFGVPLGDWFRGSLREMLYDHLTGDTFLRRGIVKREFVQYLLEEHQSGRRDNNYWLWHLLMLEVWFRESNLANHPAEVGCEVP